MAPVKDLVEVLSTPSILEGEIARSRLEDEGIPVMLKGGGQDPYRMGPAHVFVPAEFEVQARLVLESLETLESLDEDVPGDVRGKPEGAG
jgi:hypothetical protein